MRIDADFEAEEPTKPIILATIGEAISCQFPIFIFKFGRI
jgi:hypothetical protein